MNPDVIKIKTVVSKAGVMQSHKLDVDYNCPPLPCTKFISLCQQPRTYLIGAYLYKNGGKRGKLVGFMIIKARTPHGYEVLRVGAHFEEDDATLFSEMLTALPVDTTIGKVDDYIKIKVRAKNTHLCDILKKNDFKCIKIKPNGYTQPNDDMLIFCKST